MQVGPLPISADSEIVELYAPGEIPFVKRPVGDIAEATALVQFWILSCLWESPLSHSMDATATLAPREYNF